MTDRQFLDLGRQQQKEILSAHCAGIERKIREAKSKQEAEIIVAGACNGLKESCVSRLVRRAVVRKTDEFIEQYWGHDKKTKRREEL